MAVAGSLYSHDFIELHNRGIAPVNVNGWSVRVSAPGSSSWVGTVLGNVSIPAGGYYPGSGAVGAGGGSPLPTPDVLGVISIDAAGGKVVVVNNSTLLFGVPPTDGSHIVDLLGWAPSTISRAHPQVPPPPPPRPCGSTRAVWTRTTT
jgi:hypothetical protein